MKKLTWRFFKVLILLLALTITNCQKEDDYEKQQTQNIKQKSTTKTVSGKDVPEILNFIQSKSNSRMEFTLDDSNSPEGEFKSHEENLSLTTTLTDQLTQVTNSFGKSNYTFNLIEEETKEGVYFLNLVVKEYRDTFYLYIVKYVADDIWIASNSMYKNFDDFTGTIYYYSDQGIYLAKMDMASGVSTSIIKNPCPDDDQDDDTSDNDNSDNNSSGNGGAGNSGDGNATGDSGTDSGSGTGNNGSGWDGCTSYVDYEELDCNCGCGSCPVVAVILWDCGGGPNYGAEESNNTFYDFLRNPCDDIEDDCPAEIDCEFGWDDNCQCLDEPDENDDVGVLMPSPFIQNCNELQKLLDNPDIKEKLEDMQSDLFTFPNNTSEKGCSFIINSSGDISAGDVTPSTNANGNYDYDIESNRPGGAHTHPEEGLYPMFSVADIQILNSFWQTYDNPNQPINSHVPVHILVTQQGVYAIKIDDLALFAVFNGSLTEEELALLNRKLNRAYDKHHNPVTDQYGTAFEHQKEFLKFLNDNGVGISLFKANDDLTSWSRKELDNSGDTINDRPCN